MIKSYFKIAWRNLWRHKRMSFINVAGLSIGMAATILIVLWVQNELSFDNYHPNGSSIYLIRSARSGGNVTDVNELTPYVLGEHAAKEIPGVDVITKMRPMRGIALHYNGDIISEKNIAFVDDKWFDVFHYDVVDGSIDPFKSNPFSLILTESTAKRYFGREEAVGKAMRIDSNIYQVQAVVKDNPANSTFQYNVLIPVAAELTDARVKKRYLQWNNYNYTTFVKIKQGISAKKIETELSEIVLKNVKSKWHNSFNLLPIKDLHFEKDVSFSGFQHGSRTMVGIFIVLGSLILITACINYVNFTTARASIRSKEVGIRKIVGAGRLYLFGQFMSESLLISLISVLLSLMLVQASMPWYRDFTDKGFPDPMSSPVVWIIMGGTLLVSFILNGFYPALLLSSFKPLNVFRGNSVLNFRDSGLRKGLVIIQFTISVILITGTLVIFRQLKYAENIDLGYDKEQVIMVDLPYKAFRQVDPKDIPGKLNTIKQELKSQNSIADVTLSDGELIGIGNSSDAGNYNWSGKPKDLDIQAVMRLETDPDFQRTMRLKMMQGRWFNASKSDEHNAVINETAVRLFGLDKRSVIGMRFVHSGDTGVIVGVVKDFHYASMHDKIGPVVISDTEEDGYQVSIRTYLHSTQEAIAAAQKIVHNLAPDEPFVYSFMDDDYNSLYRTEQQSSVLIGLFAGIAIVVSALGLLGLAAFAAEQRVKEIGIRKVLGASVTDIVQILSSSFIKMVLIASLAAFPIAWWAMNKWLQGFAYRIPLSSWIFVISAGVALVIALITVSAQAIKAAVANPVKSLRSE